MLGMFIDVIYLGSSLSPDKSTRTRTNVGLFLSSGSWLYNGVICL